MEYYKKIIHNFLYTHNLTEENKNVLGIIFYGSRNYKTNNDNSDIDLLIITDSSNNYKGVTYIDGIKIEYFEKNIYYLLEQIDILEQSLDRSLVSIFTNGTNIFSRNQTLEYLKEEILSKNYYPQKKKKINSTILNNWYEFLNSLKTQNNFFNYVYHNLLENIRVAYHEKNGYSKIPNMKTYELYTNKKYASQYYCVNLPDQKFINLYLELILNEYNKEKLESLIKQVICDNSNNYQYKNYKKIELKYTSTIVANYVSKVSASLKNNHPAYLHYYYLTLEKIRKMYCNINDIDDRIDQFGYNYEQEFLFLFNLCLNSDNKSENIEKLFDFVSKPLNMNYKKYKILDLHK